MAIKSVGIKLSYKVDGEFVVLEDLQEIPDIGGNTDAIEITTLADVAHVYTDGLISYGDSLAFKFLYEKEQFTTLNGLKSACDWKVELPDGAACSFTGTSSVKLDSVGTNNVLTYTLAIKPNTEMVWA